MNKQLNKYEGLKFRGSETETVKDFISVEEALQININGSPLTVTMRTPGNDNELIRGLLYNEDIYKSFQEPPITYNRKDNITIANLELTEDSLGAGFLNKRSLLSVASCGICGKTELSHVQGSIKANRDSNHKLDLNNLFGQMSLLQDNFIKSGGCHAAASFSKDGKLLNLMEDIGRHNAVDKVVGGLLNSNKLSEATALAVSGRISYEIIIKCFSAKIPIIAAVSAPSSLAIDYAKELGITLLAFCRDDRFTCYSHPERII